MREWQKYQTEVAELFSSLGLEATQEKRAQGGRATHRVDVFVRGEISGFSFTWVVECKALKRPVTKAAVLTLKGIVDDLGADRGFLVSESGFQPGATAVAQSSNLTLSDLATLREAAGGALVKRRFEALQSSVAQRLKKVLALHEFTVWPPQQDPSSEFIGAINWLQWDYWRAALEIVKTGIEQVRLERWPVIVETEAQVPFFSLNSPSFRSVENLPEFVSAAERVFDRADGWLGRCELLMAGAGEE